MDATIAALFYLIRYVLGWRLGFLSMSPRRQMK